jgi:hypothetical protein
MVNTWARSPGGLVWSQEGTWQLGTPWERYLDDGPENIVLGPPAREYQVGVVIRPPPLQSALQARDQGWEQERGAGVPWNLLGLALGLGDNEHGGVWGTWMIPSSSLGEGLRQSPRLSLQWPLENSRDLVE